LSYGGDRTEFYRTPSSGRPAGRRDPAARASAGVRP